MRLIKCHVENFGKLSNFDYDFNKDLNMIFGNNGWGKSTFAAFLKVMFYGFDSDTKRAIDKERNRYKPWQGGVYGGSITFGVDDREYILTRSFDGIKPAGDEMELRDAKTNLISNDYTQNIGEEIFSIDAESFKKSIFIYQGNCVSSATDGINAKMGNLSDTTDDISKYEAAEKILTDYLNSKSLTRATGSLRKDKLFIEELKQQIRGINSYEKCVGDDNELILDLEARKKTLLEQREVFSKHLAEVSEYKDIQAKKVAYDSLVEDAKTRQEEADKLQGYFPLGVPSRETAEDAFRLAEEYEASLNRLEGLTTTDKEKQQFEKLNEEFSNGVPSTGVIKNLQKEWNERNTKINKVSSLQDKIDILEDMVSRNSKQSGGKNTGLTILGVVVLLVGVALFVLGNTDFLSKSFGLMGAVVAMVGIVLAVIGMVTKSKPKEVNDPTVNKIDKLIEDMNILLEEIESVDNKVSDFLDSYNREFDETMVSEELYDLLSMVNDYERIKDNVARFDNYASSCSKEKKQLEAIATEWGINTSSHILADFKTARIKFSEYIRAQQELKRAKDALNEFHKNNGGREALESLSGKQVQVDESVAKLNEEIRYCNENLETIEGNIHTIRTRLNKNIEILDDLKEKETVLESITLEYEKNKKKYEAVKKTKEYLEMAHNAFLLKYSAPLKAAFDKYYNLVTANADDICIDVKSNVTKIEQGAQRDLFYLSSGYQDLIGICLRLAFVDAMYKDEKPFIILDDPFANLDGEKTERVKELLKAVSKEYQLIYFTCHKELMV